MKVNKFQTPTRTRRGLTGSILLRLAGEAGEEEEGGLLKVSNLVRHCGAWRKLSPVTDWRRMAAKHIDFGFERLSLIPFRVLDENNPFQRSFSVMMVFFKAW